MEEGESSSVNRPLDASLNFHHLRYFWVTAREGSVTRAARRLRVTQPTASEQVRALEETLGEPLFRREGRRLVLTEVGRTVLRFADEIFTLGSDLVDTVRGRPTGRPARLAVGVSESVPKVVAYRILEPALGAQIVCQEDAQEQLLARLAAHVLDVVITDEPVGAAHSHAHSHLLGDCGVSVFGVAPLARSIRAGFPRTLDGAPMLLPTSGTALRREIDHWLSSRSLAPRVVGEFDDPALMSVFAQAGAGLFVAPDAVAAETVLAQGLRRVGAMRPLRQRFYVVTVERRLVHPSVQLIAGAARRTLFQRGAPDGAPPSMRAPLRRR
jgi:LysR family transcriptional activator of nhaA